VDKWLGLLTPASVLLGFGLSVLAIALTRAKVEQISRAELSQLANEWRTAAEDRDKLLLALREQQIGTRREVEQQVGRVRELDGECMQLTRENRACQAYIRLLVTLLKEHGLAVPPRES
jgi:hypothetical protein